MKRRTETTSKDDNELLTLAQASKRYDIPAATIEKWIEEFSLPAVKVPETGWTFYKWDLVTSNVFAIAWHKDCLEASWSETEPMSSYDRHIRRLCKQLKLKVPVGDTPGMVQPRESKSIPA